MKPRITLVALALAWTVGATAQILGPQNTFSAQPGTETDSLSAPRLSSAQLDELLGPIALYPDALISLILPAATAPSDVVLAARYLTSGSGTSLDSQPWDDSVKGLAHYPDVVKWMDENLEWTKQVGEAFIEQPAEVMKSVQRLRAAARAAGTLVDTPQQQVVVETETISIVPTQRDVIYVPYYDPEIVYLPRRDYYRGSFFTFSIGYPVGFWLSSHHVDWHHCRLWTIDRHARERYWHAQHDWRRPAFHGSIAWNHDSIRRPWTPNLTHRRPSHNHRHDHAQRSSSTVVRSEPASRAIPRPTLASNWNISNRHDQGPSIRDASRRSLHAPTVSSPRANNFQPAPAPQATATPAPTPMAVLATETPETGRTRSPGTIYSRGNRSPQPAGQDSSQNRGSQSADRTHRDHRTPPAIQSTGEIRDHSTRRRSQGPAAPTVVAAPAPTVAQSPAPAPAPARAAIGAQPGSRGHRQHRTVSDSSAPRAETSQASSSPSTSSQSTSSQATSSHAPSPQGASSQSSGHSEYSHRGRGR
jgi:hypothetical protein